MYPYDRALKFAKDIKKLGINEQRKSFLDQFRILITEIGKFKVIWYSFFYFYYYIVIFLLYGFFIIFLSLNWVLLPVLTIYMGFNNHHPLLLPLLLLLLLLPILLLPPPPPIPTLLPLILILPILLLQAMLWDMFVWYDLLACTTAVRRLSTYLTLKI